MNEQPKITIELTHEQVKTFWDMVDACLRGGGVKSLDKIQGIMSAMPKPIQQSPFPRIIKVDPKTEVKEE
jgi:hypothetical protein